ncbi:MAG: TusE/DsrC/DsvC family sulfur relay protein [Magnetospirillum sp.]|nr:TusE/DsrC/DsvC family sulfur relay protein [Magnetospirillum sp.]
MTEELAWTRPVHPSHVRSIAVNGRSVLTDSEGYLVDRAEWSEDFARALAAHEGIALTDEHWQVIAFIRDHLKRKGRHPSVRQMIKHFRLAWGPEKGEGAYLFALFERGGGPQKLGNRLAGAPRMPSEG